MRSPILILICCTALAACNTTKPDDNRYRYPESRGTGKTVRFASTDGRFIGLSDGSLWNVDWTNAGAARTFQTGQPVRVQKVGGSSFPYRLSTDDGRSVSARYGKKLD